MLSKAELERYARQMSLEELGQEGQQRLQRAAVLVVGAGGLGSPLLLYLTAAGMGRIGIVEDDVVELSNLNRQVLYTEKDLGRPKVEAAAERLTELNPNIEIEAYKTRFTPDNAVHLLERYDLLLDASDNFTTRDLANRASLAARVPLVHGSVRGFEGQVAVFNYRGGPCYRCLFPELPKDDISTKPAVIGVTPGVIGVHMAAEALKIILGIGEPLSGRLLLYDGLSAEYRTLRVEKNPNCPVCGGATPHSR